MHGIPISLKDQFKVKDTVSTCGCAAYVNWVSYEDGVMARLVIENGGIPFVMTNVP